MYVKFVIQQYFSIDHFYLYLFYINVKDDDRVKGIIRFLVDTQYGKTEFRNICRVSMKLPRSASLAECQLA